MITKDTSGEYINEVKKSYERISELLGSKVDVGKAGYVKLINAYGSDALIVESARQSYKMEDAELTEAKINSMILSMTRNGHTSPFEQCSITFKIKMPIFCMRQFVRNRTARLNEASMRYTKSNGECWEPDDHTWEMRILSKDFDESKEDNIVNEMEKSNKASVEVYNNLINEKVVPELARITLPLSSYTEFVWNMDLNNLRKMLCLRLDGHAQKELFQFAVAIYMLTEKVFPVTMKHFINEMYLTSKFNYESLESIQRAIYAGETDVVAEKIDTKRLEVVRNREALLKEIDYLSK